MDTKQLNDALDQLFQEEGIRIVFWHDPEREFVNTLPFILLEGVEQIRLDQIGDLETKIRLERDDPTKRFLLYSPTEEPEARGRRRGRVCGPSASRPQAQGLRLKL